GFRPVVLLVSQLAGCGRGDPEAPALVGVEERPEHAGRVEARQAQPIDRPVQADQGGAVHVADDAVVLDRFVAHRLWPPVAVSSLASETQGKNSAATSTSPLGPKPRRTRDPRDSRGGNSLTSRRNRYQAAGAPDGRL